MNHRFSLSDVLQNVNSKPQTVTDIYRATEGLSEHKSLSSAHRKRRKWVAIQLTNLAAEGVVVRDVIVSDERTWVGFHKP